MAPTCPHCGSQLDERHGGAQPGLSSDEHLRVTTDIGTDSAARSTRPRPKPSRPAGSKRKIVAIAVAGVVAAIAAFGLVRSNEPVTGSSPAQVPVASPPSEELATDDQTPPETTSAKIAPENESFIVADLFASIVDSDDIRWSAIYASPFGLQVLNASGANAPAIEVAVGFEEAARFPLISDGSTSWAIDPADLDTAYLVSTQFVVIDIDREGRVGFINDSLDPPNIGESSFGAWGPGFDLPPGADVLAVPGRALFVLPSTGGTFEYQMNGVIPYDDDVLVAASVSSDIFVRCNDVLVCELYAVTPAIPQGTVLDYDVRSNLWISPAGDVLVVQEPGESAQVVWLGTDDRAVLNGQVRAVDWSDDGSRAAILSDGELTILFDDGSVGSATLPIEPVGAGVLLVNSVVE